MRLVFYLAVFVGYFTQESQCTGIFHLRVLELTPPPGGPCSFAGSSNNGTSSSNSKQISSMRSASSSYNIGSCNTYVKACLSYAGSKGCQLGSFVSGLLPNNTFEGGFPLVTSFTFEQPWSGKFELALESWLAPNGSDAVPGASSESFRQRSNRLARRKRPRIFVESLRNAALAGLEWAARAILTLPDRFSMGKRRTDSSVSISRTVADQQGGALLARFVLRRSLMVATTAVNPTGTLSGAGAAAVTITPSFSNGGFDTWREESRQGARLSVEFRVKCAEGFTGSTCTDTCPEPNDVNARFNCTEGGAKICLEGWSGKDCERAVCRHGCSVEHGFCNKPGECRCRLGWQGADCTQCSRLPGCAHGSCNTAFECNCESGWTGLFCQRPICKTECHPTRGFCDKPDTCSCRFGWKGPNCEECKPLPGCINGSCTKPLDCICKPGWTGLFCHIPTCSVDCDPEHGFCEKPDECRCRVGWTGSRCSQCVPYPGCVHGGCTDKPWECNCLPGWSGKLCDTPAPSTTTEVPINFTAPEVNVVTTNGDGEGKEKPPCLAKVDGSVTCPDIETTNGSFNYANLANCTGDSCGSASQHELLYRL
ncbi:multiple epidermal growth factor-like domains protein 11 isoform X2 [Varroa jacobsoni]|uniref:Delta-like protein n=1 Tax=Varroa destructor TaxID=109461 RepID=A0A7M7MIY1_VARDE|nr:multiple epidermal growth factor-like domains protein 11 isoform X2 [Varroa destructor]XP_022694325.1 multiple epidermal growth factor-like domains protein 11 isoform X2 [Varroa jacobsoni]